MSELPRDFKGIWIPKEIWSNKNLTLMERCLLAEIDSLDGKDGCYASNEYLCSFLECKERWLQMALARLKSLNYIYIENFDGRTRIIRVNRKTIYELLCTSEVHDHAPLGCRIMHSSPKTHTYIENKEEKKAASEQRDADAAAFLGFLRTKPLTDDDIRKLYPKYTEAKIREAIAWVESKPNVQNFAAYVTDGLKRMAKGEKLSIKMSEADQAKENKAAAERVASVAICPNGIRIEILTKHLEIGNGVHQPSCILYTESGFKEKYAEALQKWGIQISAKTA